MLHTQSATKAGLGGWCLCCLMAEVAAAAAAATVSVSVSHQELAALQLLLHSCQLLLNHSLGCGACLHSNQHSRWHPGKRLSWTPRVIAPTDKGRH